jgi:hypothetical protein
MMMVKVEEAPPNPFEPTRDTLRFEIPPAALEELSDLVKVPAHYRPTFANSIVELFAKAHRWHRLARRSVAMNAAAKELDRVAKDARGLKRDIDKLSRQARATFGLYALRLERFNEADLPETARNQIEELLQSGGFDQAVPKIDHLSWVVGRIASAAATETWAKRKKGGLVPWINDNKTPYIDTFNRFVVELGTAVRTCHCPMRFDPDDINDALTAFLEAATPYLPNEFIPEEVFDAGRHDKRSLSSRLKRLTTFRMSRK